MKKKLSDEAKSKIWAAIVVGEMVAVFGVGIFVGTEVTKLKCQAKINKQIATILIEEKGKQAAYIEI